MTGFTEFTSINLKAVFINVDLIKQKITTDIKHEGKVIATLYFDLLENKIHKIGDFEEVRHLQEFGIDEQYIISRIEQQLPSIIEDKISNPDELNI